MAKSMNITLSMTSKSIEILEELSRKSDVSNSKLVRMFLDYFNKNPDDYKKLIEGDYDL